MVDKKLKKYGQILFAVVLSLLMFTPLTKVHAANTIDSIHITANIQADGSVVISDHRIVNAEEGTEHYISLGNLGDSELLDFTVYDENGQPLEDIGEWDVDASFEEKAGKYGINRVGDEIELCFGLGEYGRREFIIEYELSNVVTNLEDNYQSFYWQFINADMDAIDDIRIDVTTDTDFTFVNPETRFWAFGHEGGTTEITTESLIMQSGENFGQSDYVVLLGIFEGAPFAAETTKSMTSDDLIEQAMSGASLDGTTYEDYQNENPILAFIRNSADTIFQFLFGGFIIYFFIFRRFFRRDKEAKLKEFKPTVSKGTYYRDVPYPGNFIDTHYFTESEVSDYVSAFILKWISEGKLQDTIEEVGWIFKRDKLALHIDKDAEVPENPLEKDLWLKVLSATGEDDMLSEKEFNDYIEDNVSSFNSWTGQVKRKSVEKLKAQNYLSEKEKTTLGIFKSKELSVNERGQELGNNIQAFKNYLQDFSLVEEREMSHVILWKELMVWAAFLGISEEVYEQFEIVNPEISTYLLYNHQTINQTNDFSREVQSTQSSANASSRSSSYSGGGGSSFSGGGGGSSGGGSGGGTR